MRFPPHQTSLLRRVFLAASLAGALIMPIHFVLAADTAATVHPASWPQGHWPLPPDPALEARVRALLAKMSVEDKVGQMIQADIKYVTPEDVRQYRLGSILAGGNSGPDGGEYGTAAQWKKLADAFYRTSLERSDGRPAIPVMFGIDAVHGHNNLVGSTLFPQNVGLGATRDPELLREIGKVTARELRASGINWTFAPTLTVPRDSRWGRAYEGYSENPQVVAEFARAMVEGLQGKVGAPDFLDDRHVMVSVKHFLGDGGTTSGRDQGDTVASENLTAAIGYTKNTGQKVLGVVGRKVGAYPHYQSFESALKNLKVPIHSIIQTELYLEQDRNNEILRYAQQNHVSYRFVPGNTDLFVGNIAVELYAGLPVVAVHQTALIGWGRIVKRLFDIFVSGLLILILSPLIVLIMLLAKLFSPRSTIFFRQPRLTRFNHEFKVFKFRTQYQKYDGTTPEQAFAKMGKPELAQQYRDNGDFLEHDPRVTLLGRLLRKTSLDELPQLFNVFKGDISLVGPRALIPQELNAYEKKHAILSVKSGMTGLAQISGRKDIGYDERRQLDIYYVQNWSFWWDIVIMLKTVKAVISSTGAK